MRSLTILATVVGLISACGSDPAPVQPTITAGVGVTTAAGEVKLGDTRADLERVLGLAPIARDLGPAGLRLAWPELGLRATVSASNGALANLSVDAAADATTPDGLGPGSSSAEIEIMLGAPSRDPFLGTWWYRAQGIAFVVDGSSDTVTRVVLYAPCDVSEIACIHSPGANAPEPAAARNP